MKNPFPHNTRPNLDSGSLRGLLFLLLFGTIIAAKCAFSEALRLRYGFEVNTALFIWTPSLVLGGVIALLYIAGPGSSFTPKWKSTQFLLPAGLIWMAVSFSIVRNLPSTLVPFLLGLLAAAVALTLGRALCSLPVSFLAAIWAFGGLVALFSPPEISYGLLGALLLLAGTVPATIGYLRERARAQDM